MRSLPFLVLSLLLVACGDVPAQSPDEPAFAGGKADNPHGVRPYFLMAPAGTPFLPPVVDQYDRVYVAGPCAEKLSPGKIDCHGAADKLMLVRLSPTGTADWSVTLQGPFSDTSSWAEQTRAMSLQLDEKGRAVLEGTFSGTLTSRGKALLVVSSAAGFRIAVDKNGKIVETVLTAAYPFPSSPPDQFAWSGEGELLLASTPLTGDAYVFGNRSRAVVEKAPSAARPGWQKVLSNDVNWNGCDAVAALASGEALFGCHADGPLTLGGTPSGDGNGFLVRYTADRDFVAAHRFNGSVSGVAGLSNGSIVVTGQFEGTMDLGGSHTSDPQYGSYSFVTVLSGI